MSSNNLEPGMERKNDSWNSVMNPKAEFMLAHGFTVMEVCEVLGLKTLKVWMRNPKPEFEVIDHGNGVLCSGNKLCDFCKEGFLSMYGEVLME